MRSRPGPLSLGLPLWFTTTDFRAFGDALEEMRRTVWAVPSARFKSSCNGWRQHKAFGDRRKTRGMTSHGMQEATKELTSKRMPRVRSFWTSLCQPGIKPVLVHYSTTSCNYV